jgi:TetR/AcrR family fatty acid metabolism transcriptional regulator
MAGAAVALRNAPPFRQRPRKGALLAKARKTGPRREQILNAAEHIFAQKGFHPATMAEIAKRADLSEPTLYEYFSSKEEILLTIPQETSARLGELIDFHMTMAKGTESRLRVIIYLLLWIHQTNPDYAAVSYLILKQNSRFMETEAYRLLRERMRPLLEVIKEGIASGEIRSGLTPYVIRSVILGAIEHLTIRKLMNRTDDNLLDYVDELVDLVMGGVRADPRKGEYHLRIRVDALSGEADDGDPAGTAASGRAIAAKKTVKKSRSEKKH